MTTLNDHQFEIIPSAEGNNGYVFGIGAEISVSGDGFDPGENEWVTQDVQNSRRGIKAFGRDVLSAKTWVWSSHTDRASVKEAVATLDDFSAAWMPDALVRNPGALASIRYRLAGRERRVFGRPRRYAAPPTNLILTGYVPITHDFECVDSYTYDDQQSSVVVPFNSDASGGGFVLPAAMPILTMASGNVTSQIYIGGNARCYPVIRFNGPWTNPQFITEDWTLRWSGSIADGNWVEIDTRPWALTIKNNFGASVPEGLDRRTWLEDCWFAPNAQPQFTLGGVAPGGGASANIRWRGTWTSI